MKNLRVEFHDRVYASPDSPPGIAGKEVRGSYSHRSGTAKYSLARAISDPEGYVGTVAHEIGHHLQRFLQADDVELLKQQYARDRAVGVIPKVMSKYNLSTFGEWWAAQVERFTANDAMFRKGLEGKPLLQQAYLRAIKATNALQDAFMYHLNPGQNPDHAAYLYNQIRYNPFRRMLHPENPASAGVRETWNPGKFGP